MSLGPRPTPRDEMTPVPPSAFTDLFGKHYPTLLALLTVQKWDSGEIRKTTTLNIFYEGGMFKVWVNDRDLNQAVCFSGVSVTETLAAAESAILNSKADWRRPKNRK